MASVYILYSVSLDQFYVGSCANVDSRLKQHIDKFFPNAFTSKANDWTIYFKCEHLSRNVARKIEEHIKKMKSRTYIENLTKYPEITQKLIQKYTIAGSSR